MELILFFTAKVLAMHLKKYKKCPSHFSIVPTTSQFLLQMFI